MQSYLEKLEKKVKDILFTSEMVWNQQLIETIELQNMILSAKSVTMASLNRIFSLGGHVRLDGRKKYFLNLFQQLCL